MKLLSLIKEKIMFSRVVYVGTIAFLSFYTFWVAIIGIYFYTYFNGQELNEQEIPTLQFLSFLSFFVSIFIFGNLETTEERDYDDFIKSFNHSLQNELADELSKLQEDFKIDILHYKIFALKFCQYNYHQGKIKENLLNKTKKYYIDFFRKQLVKKLKEESQKLDCKSNQEMILKKLGV
ncbi:hypothetical protein [Campylobacter sp. US33a]|uniref:hypothetical protein n=1 Tax=Campylobacter sp. US33a TaxID=2498120 RepID=UPI0010686E2F|nr:hypothetical protein [Campylobacter sp. US33a]TEY00697.1 hypothetical protein ELQ16_08665 [Campylobacter sp. US33a]